MINLVNGVLRRFLHYFGHIKVTADLFVHVLGFTSTKLGLWRVLPMGTPTKNQGDSVRLEAGALGHESITLPLSHKGPQIVDLHLTCEGCIRWGERV